MAVATFREGARTVSFETIDLPFGVGTTRRRVLARFDGQLSTSSPLTHPYHITYTYLPSDDRDGTRPQVTDQDPASYLPKPTLMPLSYPIYSNTPLPFHRSLPLRVSSLLHFWWGTGPWSAFPMHGPIIALPSCNSPANPSYPTLVSPPSPLGLSITRAHRTILFGVIHPSFTCFLHSSPLHLHLHLAIRNRHLHNQPSAYSSFSSWRHMFCDFASQTGETVLLRPVKTVNRDRTGRGIAVLFAHVGTGGHSHPHGLS